MANYTVADVLKEVCRDSDEEDMVEQDSDISSVDSVAADGFLDGKDPDVELESESDTEEEVQRPAKKQRPVSTQRAGRRGRDTISSGRWKTQEDQDVAPRGHDFCPQRPPGPQGLVQGQAYSVLQLFKLYLSNDVLQAIVVNINKFGRQKVGDTWQEVSLQDMYCFLGMVVYMRLKSLHSITDYWSDSKLYSIPFPKSVMSGQKFQQILAHLHLSDPDQDRINDGKRGTPDYDRLGKIKPMYEQIREACKASYHPRQNIAVDARMVASRAHTGLRQYGKAKPLKWCYKLCVLADSLNGYTWDFFVHEGKGHVKEKGLRYDSVMHLVSTQVLGTGYKLFVDNFYTSPLVFRDLLAKKIDACGTIRPSRIGYPKNRSGGLSGRSPRGSLRWIRDGDLVFVEWRDTRDILMCSTMHAAHGEETVSRRVKGPDGRSTLVDVPFPPAVKDYNKNMSGVDVSDALSGYFGFLHKSMKWYQSFFFHFIDISVMNAYILHKELAFQRGEPPMTQNVFRETLVLELTTPAVLHMPQFFAEDETKGLKSCRVCGQMTGFRCVTCDVNLCIAESRLCFTEFHNPV